MKRLAVSNSTSEKNGSVWIHSVTTFETLYNSVSSAEAIRLQRPLTPSEHSYHTYSGRIIPESEAYPQKILHQQSTYTNAIFEIPDEDGYYNETIVVEWESEPESTSIIVVPGVTRAKLYYKIDNGCVYFVDAEEYKREMFPKQRVHGYKNNRNIQLSDWRGYADRLSTVAERFDLEKTFLLESDSDRDSEMELVANVSDEILLNKIEVDSVDSIQPEVIQSAASQTLTYCVKLRFRDGYSGIPANTNGMSWWRPRGDSSLHNFPGILVEFWDRDWDTGDDFIGQAYLGYWSDNSYACYTFNWDESQTGEPYPDIYIRTSYQVRSDSWGPHIEYCESASTCSEGTTWRDFYYSNLGQNTTKAYASLDFGAVGDFTNEVAMIMSAARKFYSTSTQNELNEHIKLYLESGGGASCSSREEIHVGIDVAWRWVTPAHEIGHAVQKQMFYQDTLYNSCPSPHGFTQQTNPHCATSEGWAEFVALASWYNVSATLPVYPTSPSTLYPIEGGKFNTLGCDWNSNIEGTMAQLFWDIYDTVGDTDSPVYDDSGNSISFSDMLRVWELFPNGSDNAENDESDSNIRDFHHNSGQLSSTKKSIVGRALSQNDGFCQPWP